MESTPVPAQTAYNEEPANRDRDVDSAIAAAMYKYCVDDLGLSVEFAKVRSRTERDRVGAKFVCDLLEAQGIKLAEQTVLDLGAGLGAMSEELVLRGAKTTAVEPGAYWARLATERVARHRGSFTLEQAYGEALPFADNTFDLITSLQVLEHVQNPMLVLSEANRVLRPGGLFYLSSENYLAFREGHYRIAWFPLLPKPVACWYLRVRNRPDKFMREAVTYVTFGQILRWASKLGLERMWDSDRMIQQLGSARFTRSWPSLLERVPARLLDKLDFVLRMFRPGVAEIFRKPL